jgi:hypothetical protein
VVVAQVASASTMNAPMSRIDLERMASSGE